MTALTPRERRLETVLIDDGHIAGCARFVACLQATSSSLPLIPSRRCIAGALSFAVRTNCAVRVALLPASSLISKARFLSLISPAALERAFFPSSVRPSPTRRSSSAPTSCRRRHPTQPSHPSMTRRPSPPPSPTSSRRRRRSSTGLHRMSSTTGGSGAGATQWAAIRGGDRAWASSARCGPERRLKRRRHCEYQPSLPWRRCSSSS